jgi:hypothetical protein
MQRQEKRQQKARNPMHRKTNPTWVGTRAEIHQA